MVSELKEKQGNIIINRPDSREGFHVAVDLVDDIVAVPDDEVYEDIPEAGCRIHFALLVLLLDDSVGEKQYLVAPLQRIRDLVELGFFHQAQTRPLACYVNKVPLHCFPEERMVVPRLGQLDPVSFYIHQRVIAGCIELRYDVQKMAVQEFHEPGRLLAQLADRE